MNPSKSSSTTASTSSSYESRSEVNPDTLQSTAVPEPKPFEGIFRRAIDLKAWDEGTVVGWVEDDFHHFGATLVHDGSKVVDIRAAAVRYPWTTCPAAMEPLRALIGQPLVERCADIARQIDMRAQCTHLCDLLGLLSAHAFHRRSHHRYHAAVQAIAGDPARAGWLSAQLEYDGQPVLAWELHQGMIMAPAALAGRFIERGFREWSETLAEIEAEHASVLRRAVFVSRVKTFKVRATKIEAEVPAVCFSYQPEQRRFAGRDEVHTVLRRFDAGPEGMIARVASKP